MDRRSFVGLALASSSVAALQSGAAASGFDIAQTKNDSPQSLDQGGIGKSPNSPEKQRDIINVKELGARGDGQHNDTSAIQAAIDAAGRILTFHNPPSVEYGSSLLGPVVVFPPGLYRVTNTINLYSGVSIVGMTSIAYTVSGTRIVLDTATTATFTTGRELGGAVNLKTNLFHMTNVYTPTGAILQPNITCTVSDLEFWIQNPNSTLTDRGGTSHLYSKDGGSIFYASTPVIDTRFKRCNFYSAPRGAITFDGVENTIYTAFDVTECEFDTPIRALNFNRCRGLVSVSDSKFYAGDYQIVGADCTGTYSFVGNMFTFKSRVRFDGIPGISSLSIVGNYFQGAGNAGNTLDVVAQQVNIVGNHFGAAVGAGIQLTGASGGCVSNNNLVSCGFNLTPSSAAMDAGAIRMVGCANVTVDGNNITTPAAGIYNGFGIISLDDGANPSANIFSSNYISEKYSNTPFRSQTRKLNVSAADILYNNVFGTAQGAVSEYRTILNQDGALFHFKRTLIDPARAIRYSLSGLVFAKAIAQISQKSSTFQSVFELTIVKDPSTEKWSIATVIRDGVVVAGLGSFSITPGNTVTWSLSAEALVATFSYVSDPCLICVQILGSK